MWFFNHPFKKSLKFHLLYEVSSSLWPSFCILSVTVLFQTFTVTLPSRPSWSSHQLNCAGQFPPTTEPNGPALRHPTTDQQNHQPCSSNSYLNPAFCVQHCIIFIKPACYTVFFFFLNFLFLLYFTLQYCIGFVIHWHESTMVCTWVPNLERPLLFFWMWKNVISCLSFKDWYYLISGPYLLSLVSWTLDLAFLQACSGGSLS